MQALNATFEGKLSLCIDIFEGNYHKKFLHQLVSSQLDMDRLDYLNRDSFFTGVSEGVVGWDRIIKMLNVANDELVVEEKGIYSIEKFLVARRLMYWQAYLHKTSVAAELMLMQILRRAKQVSKNKNAPPLFATPSLQYFLENDCVTADFLGDNSVALEHFNQLDDYDVLTSIKVWCNHSDKPLAFLCLRLMQRKLYKMHLQALPFAPEQIEKIVAQTTKKFGFDAATDAPHLVLCGTLTNSVYDPKANEAIKILLKTGVIADISDVSTMIDGNSQAVVKHYVCYPV
jgi:HD superfamily phosphohydrolase